MSSNAALIAAIDGRLRDWNQGDVVLGEAIPFVHLADYSQPITAGSQEAAEKTPDSSERLGTVVMSVPGVAVITQSCDIVRSCRDQPFVKVAALEHVDSAFLEEVRKGQRPRYAYIPGIADRALVANLDAISTVEKAIIAGVDPAHRHTGCRNGEEVRELALALSRNLSRFAFPDDFSTAMKPIQSRIEKKHGTTTRDKKGHPTNEGTLITSLREIRVACSPSWTAAAPTLMFYFVFDDRLDIPADADTIVENLVKKFKPTGPFTNVSFRLVALSEMSAEAYVSSEPLDLDYLSHSSETGQS